jgi:ubiquinone/menaquinone biosynthesis C-methylase UbiE
METQLEQIREQQKETWNKFSNGWRKWDEFTMEFLKPMGDEIIANLGLTENDTVLDVAAGTGEPGLTIAGIVKKGKVYITDLAEGMLDVANENAERKGIKNYETIACDVTEMPFKDETFDAISCRFGFMFFPDMLMAVKEMYRVLKPGGKICATVWGVAEKNFWITASMSALNKNMQLPVSPPGAPGMFRCAKAGQLSGIFKDAGLKNVSEKEINGKVNFGSVENYWNFMTDVVAPVVAAMSKADDDTKAKIKKEAIDTASQKQTGGSTLLDYGALLVCGQK